MSEFQEKIGEGMVRTGAMTQDQCDTIIKLQQDGDTRLFGEIAVSMGYIAFDKLIEFLNKKDK